MLHSMHLLCRPTYNNPIVSQNSVYLPRRGRSFEYFRIAPWVGDKTLTLYK